MNNAFKRTISGVLALSMVASTVPVVSAEDTVVYSGYPLVSISEGEEYYIFTKDTNGRQAKPTSPMFSTLIDPYSVLDMSSKDIKPNFWVDYAKAYTDSTANKTDIGTANELSNELFTLKAKTNQDINTYYKTISKFNALTEKAYTTIGSADCGYGNALYAELKDPNSKTNKILNGTNELYMFLWGTTQSTIDYAPNGASSSVPGSPILNMYDIAVQSGTLPIAKENNNYWGVKDTDVLDPLSFKNYTFDALSDIASKVYKGGATTTVSKEKSNEGGYKGAGDDVEYKDIKLLGYDTTVYAPAFPTREFFMPSQNTYSQNETKSPIYMKYLNAMVQDKISSLYMGGTSEPICPTFDSRASQTEKDKALAQYGEAKNNYDDKLKIFTSASKTARAYPSWYSVKFNGNDRIEYEVADNDESKYASVYTNNDYNLTYSKLLEMFKNTLGIYTDAHNAVTSMNALPVKSDLFCTETAIYNPVAKDSIDEAFVYYKEAYDRLLKYYNTMTSDTSEIATSPEWSNGMLNMGNTYIDLNIESYNHFLEAINTYPVTVTGEWLGIADEGEKISSHTLGIANPADDFVASYLIDPISDDKLGKDDGASVALGLWLSDKENAETISDWKDKHTDEDGQPAGYFKAVKSKSVSDPDAGSFNSYKWSYDIVWHDTSVEEELPLIDRPAAFDIISDSNYSYTNKWQNSLSGNRSGYTIGQFTGVSRDYFDENAKAYAEANKTTVDASAPTMSVNVTTYDSTGENGSVEKVKNHTYGLWHYDDIELEYTPKLQYNTLIGRADDGFGADIDSEYYDTYSQLLKDHSLAISGTNDLYDADFFDALRYFEVEWFGGTSFPIDMEEYKAAYEAYKASCETLIDDYNELDDLLKGDKYKEAYKMYAIAENEADLYDYSDLSKIGVNVSKVNKSAILKGVASGEWSVTANWNSKGRQSEVTPYMAVNVLDGNADNERLDNSTYNPKHPEVRTVSNDIEELKKYGYYVGSGTDSKGNSYDISGALKKQGISIKVYRKDSTGSTVELTEDKTLSTKLNKLIPQDNTSGVKASEIMSIVKEYEYGQVTDDFTNLPDNLKDEKYRQASKYNNGSKYVIQIAVLYTNVPTDAWLYDEPTVSADTSADWLVTEIPEYSLSEYYESLYDVPTLDTMKAQLEETVNANVKVISDGIRGTDKTGLYTNYMKFVDQLTDTEKECSQTVKSGPKPIAITNDVKPLIDVAMKISDSFNEDSNPVETTYLDKLTALKYYVEVEDDYKKGLTFDDVKSVTASDAYKNMKIIRYTAAVKNTSYTAVQRICQEIEQFNSLLEENKGYTVTTDGEDDVFIKVNSNTIHQTDNKGNSKGVPDLYWTDKGMVESHNGGKDNIHGGKDNILVDMHVFVSKNSNEDGIYFADWGTGKTYTKAASEVLKSIDMADEDHMTSLSGKTSRIFFGGQNGVNQRITSGGTTTSKTNIRIKSQSTDANYSDWVFSKHTEPSDVYWCANCGALMYGDDINDHFVHTEQVIIGYDAPPPIVVSGGGSGGGEDGDADGVPKFDGNNNADVHFSDGSTVSANVANIVEVQTGQQIHHKTFSMQTKNATGLNGGFKVTVMVNGQPKMGYIEAVSKSVGGGRCDSITSQLRASGTWSQTWNWFSYANQGGGSTGGGSGSYGSEEYSGMIPQYEERIVYSCTGPFINVGVWKIKEMLGVDSQINEDYTIAGDAGELISLAHGSYADIGINYVDSALITDILPEFNDNFENELPDFASSLGLVIDPEHATVISTTDISKQPTYEGSLSQGWVKIAENIFGEPVSGGVDNGQLVSNTLDTYYGTLNGDTEIARFQFGGDMSNSKYRANVVLMFITQSLADGYLRYRDNSEQEIADYLANVEAARNADPDAEDINAFNRGDLSWDLYRQQAYVEIYNYVLNEFYPNSDKTLNECIAAFLQKEITSIELLSNASLTYLNKKNRWGTMSTDALNAIVKSINDDGRTFSGSSGLSFFNVSSPSTLNSTGGIFSEFTKDTYGSDSNNKVMSVIKNWTDDMRLRVEVRTDRWGTTFETSDMKTSYEYKYVDVGDARSMEWSAKPTDISNGHGDPGVVRNDGLGHNGIITSDESFKGSTYFTNNSLGNEGAGSHGWKIESINTVDTINNIDTLMVSGSSVKTDRNEASNAQGITVSGTVGTTKLNISYSCLTYGDAEVEGSTEYNRGEVVTGSDGGYEWADPSKHTTHDDIWGNDEVDDVNSGDVEVTSVRFHLPAWSMPMLVVVDFPEEEVPLGDLSTTSDSSFTYRGAKVAYNLNEGYSIARVIGTEPFATKTPALKRDETYVAEADSETVVNNAYNNLTEAQRREFDNYCRNLSEAAAHGAVSHAERPSWLTDALYSRLTGSNSQLAIDEEGLSGTFTRPHSPAYEYLEDANSESEVLKTLTKVPEILKNVLGVENKVDNLDMTSMGYIVNGNRADMLFCDRMIRIKHGAAQYATTTEYKDTYRKTEKHKITTTEGVFSPLIFISNTQLNQASKDIYSFENKTRPETVDNSAIKSTFSLRHTNLVNANVDRDLNAERTIGTTDGTDIRFTLIPEVLMTYKTGYLDNDGQYIPDKWQRGKIGTAYVAGYNEYQVELPAFNKTTLNYTLNETTATDLTKSQEGNGIVIASTGVATTSATKNRTSTSGVTNSTSNVVGSDKHNITAVPVIYTGATMTAGLNFNKSVADANTLKLDSWVLNYNVESIPEYWNVQDNGTLSGMGMKYANLWLDTMKTNGEFIMTADLRNSFDVKNKDITTTETYELSSINESGNSYDARDKVTYPVEFRNGRLARVCINDKWFVVYDEGITSVDKFKGSAVYDDLKAEDSALCEAICEMDLFSFAQTLRFNDGNENFNSYKDKSIYNGNTGVTNERKTVVDKVEEARVGWGYQCEYKNWYSEDSTVFQIEHYTKTLNLPDSLDLTWKIPVGHGPSSTSTAGGTNRAWLGSIHVGVRLGNNDYSKYSLVGDPYGDDKKYPSTMDEYKCFKISSLSVNDR